MMNLVSGVRASGQGLSLLKDKFGFYVALDSGWCQLPVVTEMKHNENFSSS